MSEPVWMHVTHCTLPVDSALSSRTPLGLCTEKFPFLKNAPLEGTYAANVKLNFKPLGVCNAGCARVSPPVTRCVCVCGRASLQP